MNRRLDARSGVVVAVVLVASSCGIFGDAEPIPVGMGRIQGTFAYTGEDARSAIGVVALWLPEDWAATASFVGPQAQVVPVDGIFSMDVPANEYLLVGRSFGGDLCIEAPVVVTEGRTLTLEIVCLAG